MRVFFPQETDPTGGGSDAEEEDDKEPPEGDDDASSAGDDDGDATPSQVSKLRREAARYRTERNKLQSRVEELEGASKSDIQKEREKSTALAKENTDLQSQNWNLRVRIVAEQVGIVREARADAAILLDKSEIEDPEDDAQVEKALKKLVKAKPFLLGTGGTGADGAAGAGSRGDDADMNTLIRQRAGRA